MANKMKHRLEAVHFDVDASRQIAEGAAVSSPDVVITRIQASGYEDVTSEFNPTVGYNSETHTFRVTLQEAAEAADGEQAAGLYQLRLRATVDGEPAEFMDWDGRLGRWRPIQLLVIADGDPDAP